MLVSIVLCVLFKATGAGTLLVAVHIAVAWLLVNWGGGMWVQPRACEKGDILPRNGTRNTRFQITSKRL